MRRLIWLAAFLPGAAIAQHAGHGAAQPTCARVETVPGFAGFGVPQAGPLAIGRATRVTLRQETRPPAVAGGRPFKPGSYRGEAAIEIGKAGRYRVAISQKAWLTVQRAGGEVASVAHMHGPACSGIAKIVSFDLTPGRHALILSEAPGGKATVMVVRE
jgi:hypothetical protein